MKKICIALLTIGSIAVLAGCGGKAQEYTDAVCACKDSKCIADAANKYKDNVKDINQDQAKKIGDCTSEIVKKETGVGK